MSHGWLGHGWLRREQHLRKKPHQNQTNKVWDCENQAELPHVLPLYHSPNLSEIYSKNYAFPLPSPFFVEVLVFLYLGTEDTLSVNLYGFLAVLYYSCSSEIPQLGPAFPQEIFSCSDLYSKWPQHFRKAKTMQLLTSCPVLWARIFMSPREFIYVIRYTCAWIHTAFCKQAGSVFCPHSTLVQKLWKCNHKVLSGN